MQPRLFISYSRRQTPFVDRLAARLTKDGFPVWLDYHDLVPARPWREQIEQGIAGTDVFLLVVSPDSIRSEHVRIEYEHALKLGKRIVLVLFETTRLPDDLQNCEWVDLRASYTGGTKRLVALLISSHPSVPGRPAPQRWFKAPPVFWLSLLLSIVVAISSLPAAWSIFIPYLLLPLPWQIYKRNYSYGRVLPVLLIMPLFVGLSYGMYKNWGFIPNLVMENVPLLSSPWWGRVALASWGLYLLLRSPWMQQRGGPEAARVRFANAFKSTLPKPRQVVFAIDHAPEDSRFARELRRGLEAAGHRLTGPGESPEAAFVLISAYKTSSNYDPETQAVYPLLLQSVGDIDPKLQRIQWIDFRRGIRNLGKLARLLPEPGLLLRALAMPPTGNQEVYPFAVNALQIFYLLTGMITGGSLLFAAFSFVLMISRGSVAQSLLTFLADVAGTTNGSSLGFAALSAGFLLGRGGYDHNLLTGLLISLLNGTVLLFAVLHAVRALRTRTGGAADWYPLLVLTILQALVQVSVSVSLNSGIDPFSAEAIITSWRDAVNANLIITILLFPVGLLTIFLIAFFRWPELHRWFPRRQAGGALFFAERLLLLYMPARKWVLPVYILFHAALLAFLSLLALAMVQGLTAGSAEIFLLPAIFPLLLAVGLRWLARRLSK